MAPGLLTLNKYQNDSGKPRHTLRLYEEYFYKREYLPNKTVIQVDGCHQKSRPVVILDISWISKNIRAPLQKADLK